MTKKPDITEADLSAGVEMGKLNDGYFSDIEKAQSFIDIAIAGIIPGFGPEIRYAGFGGGEGFLTKQVADAIAANGRRISTLVVDANAEFLAKAAQLGLDTLCADLEDVALTDYDLVTMRSVNHYNDMPTQQRIVDAAFNALAPGGYLVSQSLAGPTERYCRLASQLSKIPTLGRVRDDQDRPHITSEEEFAALMTGAGFGDVGIAGYAPDIIIGPEYYWARFNAHARGAAAAAERDDEVRSIDARHRTYVRQANHLVAGFLDDASEEETALISRAPSSYCLALTFPIFVGRCA